MTNQDIESGARQVEAAEHMAAGLTEQADLSINEREPEEDLAGGPVETMLGELTLSMFQQGQTVRVRVGNATAPSELYEAIFESADEANTALLDANILTPEQVPDVTQVAGTGIHVSGLSAEQLKAAGLKRHQVSTL
jgi:hypothetical protein